MLFAGRGVRLVGVGVGVGDEDEVDVADLHDAGFDAESVPRHGGAYPSDATGGWERGGGRAEALTQILAVEDGVSKLEGARAQRHVQLLDVEVVLERPAERALDDELEHPAKRPRVRLGEHGFRTARRGDAASARAPRLGDGRGDGTRRGRGLTRRGPRATLLRPRRPALESVTLRRGERSSSPRATRSALARASRARIKPRPERTFKCLFCQVARAERRARDDFVKMTEPGPGDLLRGTWQLGPPRSDTTTRARIDAQDERNYRAQGGHDVLGVLRRGGARAGKDGRCVDPTTLARVLSSRVSGIPEEGSELRRHPRTRPLARSLARPPPRDLVHLVDIPVS